MSRYYRPWLLGGRHLLFVVQFWRGIVGMFLVLLLPLHLWAVWPLSWELGREKNYLGPLVSYEKEDGNDWLTIRPFFSRDSAGGWLLQLAVAARRRHRQ